MRTISNGKEGVGLTYVCLSCGFLFRRAGEVRGCPSCEKDYIRTATEEEALRLTELLEQGRQALNSGAQPFKAETPHAS